MYFALDFPLFVVCSALQSEIWNGIKWFQLNASLRRPISAPDLFVDYANKFSYFDPLFAAQILFFLSVCHLFFQSACLVSSFTVVADFSDNLTFFVVYH